MYLDRPQDRTASGWSTDMLTNGEDASSVLRPAPALPARVASVLGEAVLMAALFGMYQFGRALAHLHVSQAFSNADAVWAVERTLHLPREQLLQQGLLNSPTLAHLANVYYAQVHFPATSLFLAFVYFRRRYAYLWIRRIVVTMTGLALLVHFAFPLAPPRMLPVLGFVDVGRVYGPSAYPPVSHGSMADQFAAMPSIHVGWALIVAIGLIAVTSSRWRWLWLLYPMLTLTVVIATANHYWLDCMAAATLVAGALLVHHHGAPGRSRVRRPPARRQPPERLPR